MADFAWMEEPDIRLFLKESRLAGYRVSPPEDPNHGCLIEESGQERDWVAFRRDPTGGWRLWGLTYSRSGGGIVIREEVDNTELLLIYLEQVIQRWD